MILHYLDLTHPRHYNYMIMVLIVLDQFLLFLVEVLVQLVDEVVHHHHLVVHHPLDDIRLMNMMIIQKILVRYSSFFLTNIYVFFLKCLDLYSSSPPRRSMSPTLHRDSFRYRYRYSPATDLSDKVINTLRRNLDHYVSKILHFFIRKTN